MTLPKDVRGGDVPLSQSFKEEIEAFIKEVTITLGKDGNIKYGKINGPKW